MHKRTLLAAVATAAFAAILTPSLSSAQNPPPKTSKGEVAMAPNFGSLISAINASSTHNTHLKGLTSLTAENVQVVNVGDLLKGNDVKALENAISKNQADIDSLRATLGANQTLNDLITKTTVTTTTTTTTTDTTAAAAKAQTLTTADIVAADMTPDGKVVLSFWK
jgi:hypothetical protein